MQPPKAQYDYDVIIIGGGIHGVGIAQAAAAFGYRVLLLEKNTLASGTSSRSSKLIHGGLRYLESHQFQVVRACLAERQRLVYLAPELVKLVHHYIPIYHHSSRPAWKIRLGLSMYQMLGQLHTSTAFQALPNSQWEKLDGLQQHDLDAVFQYWDAQTNDLHLTQAVAHSAKTLGAQLLEHAQLDNIALIQGGVDCSYRHHTQDQHATAHLLINAAGPWVNTVLENVTPSTQTRAIDLVQGAHIVLDHPAPKGIYYVEAPTDQRAVFIMPWQGKTLVGTTETAFTGNPDNVTPTEAEIAYLQETVQAYFPAINTHPIECFAGLRVLPQSGKSPFSRSRETILHPDQAKQPRIITIYGGKLTEYRLVSERLMKKMQPFLPPRTAIARTTDLPLTPAP